MNKYMEHLSELLSEGLEKYSCSEQYKNLLSVMSKFHSYSANNCLLIALQCPEASYIAGYNKWRSDFHRQVKKGAKAIQIKAPMTYRDKETDEERLGFKATSVFNIDDKVHALSSHLSATFTRTSGNFGTSSSFADLSVFPSLICDFCPSDQEFTYDFLQIPPHDEHPCQSAIYFLVA